MYFATHNIRWLFMLVTLVVIAVLLRFHGLDQKIVWHDEVASRVLASGGTMDGQMKDLYVAKVFTASQVLKNQEAHTNSSLLNLISDLAHNDPQHPPVYYVLAKIWVNLWGGSAFALRTLSVAFSVLSVMAMFWLMRELDASNEASWIAALLTCISPMLILYGQEAREYALWFLELILSSAALLRALRKGERATIGDWLLYFICTLFAVYTSFSSISLIIVQTIYVTLITKIRLSRSSYGFVISLILVGIFFLPWALNLLSRYQAFSSSMAWSSVIVIPRTAVIRILSLNFTRNLYDFWPDVEQDQSLPILVSTISIMVITFALFLLLRRQQSKSHLYLLLLICIPTLILLIPDLLWGGIRSSNARYLMPVWIGVLAALSFMFDTSRISTRVGRAISRFCLGGIIFLSMLTNILHSHQIAPWTKSLSIGLPRVAQLINESNNPLVVGNQERHHPGNLFALSNLLSPQTKMQFVPIAMEASWVLPEHNGDVFLYSPTDQFRYRLEKNNNVRTRLLDQDLFFQLWKVE
jgi:uncharacterized membrane protein